MLVVFCHYELITADSVLGNIGMALAWCAVPNFMMASGAVLHSAKGFSWKKHFKRVLRTYITLCFWRFAFFVFFSYFGAPSYQAAEVVHYTFLFADLKDNNAGILNFMMSYLNAMLIYPITFRLFKNGKEGKTLVAYCMGLLFINGIGIHSFDFLRDYIFKGAIISTYNINTISRVFPFVNSSGMLFYFLLGAFLHEYKDSIKERIAVPYMGFWLVLLGLIGILVEKYFETGSFAYSSVKFKLGYSSIATMVLSIGVYMIFLSANPTSWPNRALQFIGKYTMGIYYMHLPVLVLFVNSPLFGIMAPYKSFLLNCAKTVAVCAICLAATLLFRKIPLLKKIV